nr:MAG TPA: hypothetical protein [Caudoviricetes sp.]
MPSVKPKPASAAYRSIVSVLISICRFVFLIMRNFLLAYLSYLRFDIIHAFRCVWLCSCLPLRAKLAEWAIIAIGSVSVFPKQAVKHAPVQSSFSLYFEVVHSIPASSPHSSTNISLQVSPVYSYLLSQIDANGQVQQLTLSTILSAAILSAFWYLLIKSFCLSIVSHNSSTFFFSSSTIVFDIALPSFFPSFYDSIHTLIYFILIAYFALVLKAA